MIKLREFTIEGYKSFAQSTQIELAPLTIIFGKNDSGKSSLCRVPLFLTHIFRDKAITPFPLELSGIDFGRTLKEICYREKYQGFTGSLKLENAPFKLVELGGTELPEKEHRQLVTIFNVSENSENTIKIEDEENFENIKQLINQKLKPLKTLPYSISFIGGMRMRPQRMYRFPSGIRPDVEPDGSHAPHWLYLSEQRDQKLLKTVSRWFQEYVGLKILIEIEKNRGGFEIQAEYPWQKINIADTGEGIGQVLPIVTTLTSMTTDMGTLDKKSLLILEQPELHLHPFAHTGIAELIVAAMNTKHSILVETHSDTLLLRIRRAIAEQRIPHTLVRFYYVERNKDGSSISQAIELNDRGTPSWWPKGIFSEDQEEYHAIRRALNQR
jgi:predicted ATPase